MIRLFLTLSAIVAGFLGGWTVRDWKADASLLKVERIAAEERDRLAAKIGMLAFEQERLRIALDGDRRQTKTTIREVYRNVQVRPDCALHADARRMLGAARHRANAAASGKSGN